MARGGARPGAGRKPKAVADAPAGKPKAAPRKKPAAQPAYVDGDGVKTEAAPPNWPFGQTPPAEPPPKADLAELTPLDYLLQIMRDDAEDKRLRIQAATLAAPYVHARKAEGSSKKEEAAAKVKAAGAGKFGRREPPKLVAAGGQKL